MQPLSDAVVGQNSVPSLDERLTARFRALGVRIDISDPNTIALKNVPANSERFSKSRTNLLMQRPRAGLPFIIAVDEDLEYLGTDEAIARLFAGAGRQRGWRVLRVDVRSTDSLQDVLERALQMVGFDGREPSLDTASMTDWRAHGLLAAGENLTRLAREGRLQPTVGGSDAVETVITAVLQRQPRLPVLVAEPGVGKTNLLHAVAARLNVLRPSLAVVRVDLGQLFAGTLFDADRENVLAVLLSAPVGAEAVLCLERIDLVRRAAPQGALQLAAALDRGARIVGTALPQTVDWLNTPRTAHRFALIELDEPPPAVLGATVSAHREALAWHHHVAIDASMIPAAIERAQGLKGRFPAKALALLDAAAARAVAAGSDTVDLVHLFSAANDFAERADETP